ncbi:MAG: HD domain-containing protein, partial [Deltaproteobacteria bacterium]|nr:HD domain-containing protein [Deltaproteobacteria bacterium]
SPLDRGQNIPAGPLRHHGHDRVLDHTRDVMNAIAAMPLPPAERPLAVWMGLCHDLGKAETEPEKLPRHIGHESRGAVLARELSRRLRLPRLWEKAGSLAASLHMKAGQYPLLRPGTKVDLLQTLAASRLADPFIALVVADSGEPPLRNQLQRDLETILTVSLPEKWRGRGRESAAELRRLRITALQRFAAGKELDP